MMRSTWFETFQSRRTVLVGFKNLPIWQDVVSTDMDLFGYFRQASSARHQLLTVCPFSIFYIGLDAWNKIDDDDDDDDDDDEKTSRWCAVPLYAVTCHPCHVLQSATPFHFRLRACHGTDGQTDDGPQRLTPSPHMGTRHNKHRFELLWVRPKPRGHFFGHVVEYNNTSKFFRAVDVISFHRVVSCEYCRRRTDSEGRPVRMTTSTQPSSTPILSCDVGSWSTNISNFQQPRWIHYNRLTINSRRNLIRQQLAFGIPQWGGLRPSVLPS